jgi:drug/metabolite transporter (DMT)-like permease
MDLVAMVLYFICLAHLHISYATALGFLTPILVLPMAAVVFGRKNHKDGII